MYTNAHIFKKLGFTTTIQEYFAEHYTTIENHLIMTSKFGQALRRDFASGGLSRIGSDGNNLALGNNSHHISSENKRGNTRSQ